MKNFKIGDKVEVADTGLAMLKRTMEQITGKKQKPNNIGKIIEIWEDDDEVLVDFKLTGKNHSQAVPYKSSLVKLYVKS